MHLYFFFFFCSTRNMFTGTTRMPSRVIRFCSFFFFFLLERRKLSTKLIWLWFFDYVTETPTKNTLTIVYSIQTLTITFRNINQVQCVRYVRGDVFLFPTTEIWSKSVHSTMHEGSSCKASIWAKKQITPLNGKSYDRL